MATNIDSITRKGAKRAVLGRSAATGRLVMAPVATKNGSVSEQRIAEAVKSLFKSK